MDALGTIPVRYTNQEPTPTGSLRKVRRPACLFGDDFRVVNIGYQPRLEHYSVLGPQSQRISDQPSLRLGRPPAETEDQERGVLARRMQDHLLQRYERLFNQHQQASLPVSATSQGAG